MGMSDFGRLVDEHGNLMAIQLRCLVDQKKLPELNEKLKRGTQRRLDLQKWLDRLPKYYDGLCVELLLRAKAGVNHHRVRLWYGTVGFEVVDHLCGRLERDGFTVWLREGWLWKTIGISW